ncbi:glutamine ABC transporter permease [Bacillus amyloliquefaciens]|jgi:putative glutamine transport system permease protein|uniref:Glutamine ABC transporter (Permease) n=1 Tax=Bacillus amyloliquefaciens (strain ATCC 23350 / DSM 7 / BCRC 11601 / CCUG 28519 / NBRC 15535 / NRRL B-14393 / F) TaxID=692420 RepID=A0A9P1JIK8_BACAS|nr:amino acid ABC transporter permease [Bacillus amyloliquefaciens]AZV90020.1 glutamine ABC transporter permease [Bacillus amyloliquefaciens]MDR4377728.1 amino acid ABC transporter permease [Bacillus amyloliquefaciens]MEC1839570.1 amino acid ABC transporter permease [Bacillus amyloliquefaciens]MEC1847144.1 amino acid ABC transporter permease [Bacillus amyloliquefaciens]MEC1929765.1 amino acid ABC transporter permease [Bacillus amyloliquefaciens]
MNFSILTENFDMYMDGFLHTLLASFIALAGSFALGVLIAVMRITAFKPIQWIGTAYVEFIRNIPLLLITFVFYFGLPNAGLRLDGFQAGTIALTIYTSAFIAEAIRAGIQTVSKGQMEAARSSGFTYSQAMRYVILPQAVKIVIPPLGNQFLNLVKNSSILGVVAGLDLMYQADLVSSSTLVVFDVFVALFYLMLTIPLSIGVHYLERRLGKSY